MKYLIIVILSFLSYSCSSPEVAKPRPPSMDEVQRCTVESRLKCMMDEESDLRMESCEREEFLHCMGSK